MEDAFIIDAVRTPFGRGKPNGQYADTHPVDLHAHVIREVVRRTGVPPEAISDVISGAVGQVGEQSANTARWAALAAGLPVSVPAVTIDRQCGSSQQALHFAAQGIQAGAYDVVVASGAESMSRIPIGSQLAGRDPFGPMVQRRFDPGLVPQGISAELIASRWAVSRREADAFALDSHRKATQARHNGLFDRELSPLSTADEVDQSIRPDTTSDALAALRPAFEHPRWSARFPEISWSVTAGNASPVNDGAAAVLVAGSEALRRFDLVPRARVVATAVVGDDPIMMLTGIIPATERALRRAGLSLDEIDAFEVNEAFASVVLAWLKATGADPAKVNVHGGALAIGHPLGASGARLTATLLGVLDATEGRYGLQVICEAGGLANAMVIERLD
ncbi:MAG: thiolase family protein [Curtobacterium sp.]